MADAPPLGQEETVDQETCQDEDGNLRDYCHRGSSHPEGLIAGHCATTTSEKPRGAAELLDHSLPEGLTICQLADGPKSLTREALRELTPHFPTSRSKSSAMFEIGYSFHAMEQHREKRLVRDLHAFPAVHALLTEAMSVVGGTQEMDEASLNVICRRYTCGQGIPMHVDRKELFSEDVYGCILKNTSDGGLAFQKPAASSSAAQEALQVCKLPEQEGVCFLQKGAARFEWRHGVAPPITKGERVSVTWRWFAEEGGQHHNHNRAVGEAEVLKPQASCKEGAGGEGGHEAEAGKRGRRWGHR